MSLDRRTFLAAAAAAAMAGGAEVTLVNRGVTNPHFVPDLEKLRGNRYPERGEGLAALAGDREWDVVVDTWQDAPRCVEETCALLQDRASAYVYISSIAVYRNYVEPGMDEDAPLMALPEEISGVGDGPGYSDRKRISEALVRRAFGERVVIPRCGSISGRDYSGRPPSDENQQSYWPLRILLGGDVLAPAEMEVPFQYIDVKDMAAFALGAAEQSRFGAFNLVTPPMMFGDYIAAISRTCGTRHRLIPVPLEILDRYRVSDFSDLRSYIRPGDSEPGFFQLDSGRAVANGLTFRPLEETLDDFYLSVAGLPVSRGDLQGLAGDLETQILREVLG